MWFLIYITMYNWPTCHPQNLTVLLLWNTHNFIWWYLSWSPVKVNQVLFAVAIKLQCWILKYIVYEFRSLVIFSYSDRNTYDLEDIMKSHTLNEKSEIQWKIRQSSEKPGIFQLHKLQTCSLIRNRRRQAIFMHAYFHVPS